MENIIYELWNLIISLIEQMGRVWGWLSNDIVINISWLKIPLLFPDGININLGFNLLSFFGVGIIVILLLWVVKALVPMG